MALAGRERLTSVAALRTLIRKKRQTPEVEMATDFRAFVIGPDGHVTNRIDLVCDSEDEARERAAQLVDGRAIELWEGARRIARFEPKP